MKNLFKYLTLFLSIALPFFAHAEDTCRCSERGGIFTSCEDNDWDENTQFDYFDFDHGTSRVSSNGGNLPVDVYLAFAYCTGEGLMAEEEEKTVDFCESDEEKRDCDRFCTDQISDDEAEKFANELSLCVRHFVEKCNSSATVVGAYTSNSYHHGGWWEAYGTCEDTDDSNGGDSWTAP